MPPLVNPNRWALNRRFEFQKRGQFFTRTRKSLCVVAIDVNILASKVVIRNLFGSGDCLSHHDVAFGSTVWWRQRPVRQHLVGRHSSRRCATRGARTTLEKLPDAADEQGSELSLTPMKGVKSKF